MEQLNNVNGVIGSSENGNDIKYVVKDNDSINTVILHSAKDQFYEIGYKDGEEVGNKKLENHSDDFNEVDFVTKKITTIVNPEQYIKGYYDGLCSSLNLEPDEEFIESLLTEPKTR